MNYLEKIILKKRKEVEAMKKDIAVSLFENSPLFNIKRPSFYDFISKPEPSVIAEFKRKSPSKGILNENADIVTVAKAYEKAGARALSVLTDIHFDGRPEDISAVFGKVSIPVLRKDFIIDEYQIIEAKALGASAILLIAAVLEKKEIESLTSLAESLELDVLLELHEKEEVFKIPDKCKIIGINNRDLKTFEVNTGQSVKLAHELPADFIKVSESGISSVDTILSLYHQGFDAFLIGETFMKNEDPGSAAHDLIVDLRNAGIVNK